MNVLPDSRLASTVGDVVADWEWYDEFGVRHKDRLTLQPIYCFNCGTPAGYVPRDVMSFVSWLCQPCSEKHGEAASLWDSSDREFWRAVGEEMRARFGRALTQGELAALADQNRLGRGLELLARESPFKG